MEIDKYFEGASSSDNYIPQDQVDSVRQIMEEEEEQQLTPPPQAPQQEAQPQAPATSPTGNPIGDFMESVTVGARDWIDNTFQGDQLTPEQIRANRQGMRQQEAVEQDKLLEANTPVQRVAQGAVRGAGESIGTFAELVGDTTKTFAGLAQESDNPFSNKYEWAKWDLGKDKYGAQSGAGKVVQGFAEFGLLMFGTGGFSAATKGASIAQVAAHGAKSGIAADLISASKGDGNLSNLIKENAPEWYPTWLTALAVDENDGPWEAMLKTALEGAGMGAMADAAMAYVTGARAARKAAKAGKSVEEQGRAAVAAAEQHFNLYHATTSTAADKIVKGGFRSSNAGTNILGQGVYFARDPKYASMYGESVLQGSDAGLNIRQMDRSLLQFMDESGIPYQAYDLSTGKNIDDWRALDPQTIADDVGFDISDANKAKLQEALSEGGKYDGVEYDPVFSANERSTGTEVLVFDPVKADYAISERAAVAPEAPAPLVRRVEYGDQGQLDLGNTRISDNSEDVLNNVFDQIVNGDEEAGLKAAAQLSVPELRSLISDMGILDYVTDDSQFLKQLPIDLQIDLKGDAVKPKTLKNGSTIDWIVKDVTNSSDNIVGVPTYRIDWDISRVDAVEGGLGEGASGVELYKQFNDVAAELKPGSVVVAEAAEDGYGRGLSEAQARKGPVTSKTIEEAKELFNTKFIKENGDAVPEEMAKYAKMMEVEYVPGKTTPWDLLDDNMKESHIRGYIARGELKPTKPTSVREKLYKRAGLSEPDADGNMYGVVMQEKSGRRRLQPLDIKGDVEAQVNEVLQQTAEQGNLLTQWKAPDIAEGSGLRQALEDSITKGNQPRYTRLAELVDQQSKGIPVYWDDVANAYPEYFTIPGQGRLVPDDFHPSVYEQLAKLDPDGGATLNPFTGQTPPSGYMVAIDGAVLDDVTQESVAAFIARNRDVLSRDDVFLGSWVSKETGKPVVELSRLVQDGDEAFMLGRAFDQEGIFRMDDFEYISTGGADNLRTTKGAHMVPAAEVPTRVTQAAPATQAVAQQAAVRPVADLYPTTTVSRSITDAQLEKIARATSDEAAAVLMDVAERNPVDLNELSKISRMSVDEITQEAGKAIQETLGTAGEVDWTKIRKQAVGDDMLLDPVGIVQVRGMMQEVSSRAAEVANKIAKGYEKGADIYNQFEALTDSLKGLLRIHKESANAYSRYLNTYSIDVPALNGEVVLRNPIAAVNPENLASRLDEADKALNELKAALKSGNPQAQAKAARVATAIGLADGDVFKTLDMASNAGKIAKAQVGDELLNLMYNSMLSSPATQIVNTTSNAINTIYRPLAAVVGGDANQKKQAISAFYGFSNNLSESWDMAIKALKDGGANVQGSKGFIQRGEVAQHIEQLTIAAEQSGKGQWAAGMANHLHDLANFPLFNWPSKLLTTSDEFFKAMVARMEFQSRTMGDAIEMAQATGKPLDEVFQTLLEKNRQYNISKGGEIVNPDLLNVAKEITFQTELDGWAKSFSEGVSNVPILRPFFPFVKTGHNIMVYTGQHVPLLSRHLDESKAIMSGTDEYAKAVLKGKQAVGRGLVLTGAIAAYNGMITGNGPPDPAERKIWMQTNQPRSIKLPDGTFVSYDRIEPFGQILSAVADLVEMSKYAYKYGMGEDQIEYLAGYLTYAIANNFTNKSYMQGVVPLGKALTPGYQGWQTMATLGLETVNNFFPLSGARRAFANLMTPFMQEYNNQVDRFWASASGGLIQKGSVAHDWLDGSPLDSPSGSVNGLSPVKVIKRKQSPARDAMEDIGFDSSVIMKTLQGVELTAEHKSRLQQLMGQSGLEKELNKLVTAKTWQEAKDDYFERVRQGAAGDKRNEIFYDQFYNTVIDARDMALVTLKEEYPELMMQITDKRILRTSQRAESVYQSPDFEYLTNMPN